MSKILVFIGRLLIVSLFLLSGFNKLTNPKEQAGYLSSKYKSFYTLVHDRMGLPLPVSNEFVGKQAKNILFLVGALELALSIMLLMNSKTAAMYLFWLTLLMTVMIHNPFYEGLNDLERSIDYKMVLMNFGIMASLLMVSGLGNNKDTRQKR